MLNLTRRRGEKIVIGEGADAITITICGIQGGNVRLGITAPEGVVVLREELIRFSRDDDRDHPNADAAMGFDK